MLKGWKATQSSKILSCHSSPFFVDTSKGEESEQKEQGKELCFTLSKGTETEHKEETGKIPGCDSAGSPSPLCIFPGSFPCGTNCFMCILFTFGLDHFLWSQPSPCWEHQINLDSFETPFWKRQGCPCQHVRLGMLHLV